MKKTVGCFTDEKLQELSEQPNTVVYKPTHDVTFTPWPASKVSTAVDDIVKLTKTLKEKTAIDEACQNQPLLAEFSDKYKTMYSNLTNENFVADVENIRVLKRIILLKAAVDQNMTSEQAAQAQVSDIAIKSLSSRVKNSS